MVSGARRANPLGDLHCHVLATLAGKERQPPCNLALLMRLMSLHHSVGFSSELRSVVHDPKGIFDARQMCSKGMEI